MAPDIPALSLEAYRVLFEANPHAILLYDTTTWRILAANQASVALYGWTRDELLSKTVLDIRPETERARFQRLVPILPDSVTHLDAIRQQTRDGREIIVDVTTAALRLDDGRHVRLTVSKDITEETRLREASEQLAAIVAGSHDAIILTDLDGRIQSWNPGAERMLGYTEAEVRGQPITVIHPPDIGGPNIRKLAADVAAGRTVPLFRGLARHKDGRSIVTSMTLSPTYGPAGDVAGISGIERDVTERDRADREVRESEARFSRIFQSDLILAAVIDVKRQTFKDVNDTFLRYFGLTRDELVGASVEDYAEMWLDPAERSALLAAWREGRAINGVEVGYVTRRGLKYALVSVERSPAGDEDILVMVDITQRRALEIQLSEARRLEALGRLAGGVAHDFNNMLSVMSGYAELLEEQLPDSETARADLEEIKRAAARATELTRQLLAFGRRQMLQPRTFDLNQVVSETETFLRRVLGESITLELTLSERPLWVEADPSQVEQVLLNLASNARDAVDGAGAVQISTRARRIAKAWAQERGLPAGPAAELAVRDTGRGMDAETLQRIFEPFYTTKPIGQGTGLGLATVYGIVKQSGGHIDAASKPGEGTQFSVIFPQAAAPEQKLEECGIEAAEGGSETILLVEDEAAVATLAESLLRRMGYKVLTAHSAAEAIAAAGRHAGAIDLVLADVVMPGASGRDLVEKLRGSRPDIRALYMSGYPSDAVVRHGVEEGKVPFLQKPFTTAALAARIREALS